VAVEDVASLARRIRKLQLLGRTSYALSCWNGESIAAEPLDETQQTRRWAQERRSVERALERDARRLQRPGFRLLTRRPRLRSRRRQRNTTTRTSHGPPGRSTDDDPHERPLARLARLRALVDAHLYPSRVWAEIARGLERERQL